jgi:hypothetical protein
MNYTPEQRALITAIGFVSAEIDQVVGQHQQAQVQAGTAAIDVVTALRTAIEQSNRLAPLIRRHGDLWREFLDSL